MKRLILLSSLLLFFFYEGRASLLPNLQYYQLGIEQGLSNNDVTSIVQSKSGFIWVGTYDGLNRYDGHHLISFRSNHSNHSISLPNNRIESLLETSKGNLLISTMNGLVAYNFFRENFQELKINDGLGFEGKAILKEFGNKTFIGSSKYGLAYSVDDKHYYSIPLLMNKVSISTYNVVGMDIAVNGDIWLVIKDIGLCKYNRHDELIYIIDKRIKDANGIYSDKDAVYIYHEKQIKILDLISKQWKTHFIPKPVLNILRTQRNELLVSTDGGGVYVKDDKNGIFFPKFTKEVGGLLSNSVRHILEDHSGNLWCATLRGGITVFTKKKSQFNSFNTFKSVKQGSNIYVSSFEKSLDENIWVGTDGLGLFKWDKQNDFIKPVYPEALRDKSITKLLVDGKKRLWISTWGSGIYIINPLNELKQYDCLETGMKRNNIWNLFEDKSGEIWASSFGEGGLFKWNEKLDKFEIISNRLGNVLCFLESKSGEFWLGNDSEIILYNQITGGIKKYGIGYRIRSIVQDIRTDYLWIATEGNGLLSLNKNSGKYKRYSEAEGLVNNNVNQILMNRNFLWLSTFNGISKFDLNTHQFTSFDVEDGLQSNQFSYNAALKISDHEFVFGGIKGLTSFDPNMNYDVDNIFQPQLSKLTIDDQSLSNYVQYNESLFYQKDNAGLNTLLVPYDQANLKFEFTAFPYFNTNKVKYEVKLLGHDPKWVELGNHPIITYNKLEPGRYTFVARVIGKDNTWTENQLLFIKILPPWYLTWWAILIYFIAVGLVLYIIYNVKQSRTKLIYEAKLSQIAYEKEHELHLKKMNVFSDIVNELRNPLTFVINPLKSYLRNNDDDIEIKNALQNANKLLVLAEQLIPYQLDGNEIKQLKLEQVDLAELINSEVHSLIVEKDASAANIYFTSNAKHSSAIVDKDKIAMSIFNTMIYMLTTFKEESLLFIDLDETESDLHINFYFNSLYKIQDVESTMKSVENEDYGIGISLVNDFVRLHQGQFKIDLYKQRMEITLLKGDWFSTEHNRLWSGDNTEDVTIINPLSKETSFEISAKKSILLIDYNDHFRVYFKRLFSKDYHIIEYNSCDNIIEQLPYINASLIVCDFFLDKSGVTFCSKMKSMKDYRHIPIILLSAVGSENEMLEAMESGANDVLRKPIDEQLLITKIKKSITELQVFEDYFLNQITVKGKSDALSIEDKEFLDHCIHVITENFQNELFNAQELALQCNMSYSNLYKKIKAMCALSISEFIRSVRLRRAAELILQSQMNISEIAMVVGFLDLKYFRQKFKEVYGVSPSQYLKDHRIRFNKKYRIYSN